jgi:hypothetical protein
MAWQDSCADAAKVSSFAIGRRQEIGLAESHRRMTGVCANETCSPAEAVGVDVEHKMLIAAIDVHSVTAK